MDNYTPIKTAEKKKRKVNKFLMFGNLFFVVLVAVIGIFYYNNILVTTKSKAADDCIPGNTRDTNGYIETCAIDGVGGISGIHWTRCEDAAGNGQRDCVGKHGGGGGYEPATCPPGTWMNCPNTDYICAEDASGQPQITSMCGSTELGPSQFGPHHGCSCGWFTPDTGHGANCDPNCNANEGNCERCWITDPPVYTCDWDTTCYRCTCDLIAQTNSPTPVPPTATPPIITNTPTATPVITNTPTPTATPVITNTPTMTPTGTIVPSNTPTVTPTGTPNPTETPTMTPTGTPNPTETPTMTPTPTEIILAQVSPSPTAVAKLLQTGVVKSFMFFIPAIIMLVGLIL